jgi:hypothetical protein
MRFHPQGLIGMAVAIGLGLTQAPESAVRTGYGQGRLSGHKVPASSGSSEFLGTYDSSQEGSTLLTSTGVPEGSSSDSVPTSLVRSASENVELVGQVGGAIRAVAAEENYVYVGVGPRLVVLDVSDASSPTAVGRTNPLPSVIESICVTGDYAYVGLWEGGVRVVDVTTPSDPIEIGRYNTGGHVLDVAVNGKLLYTAEWHPWPDDDLLSVVDVSNVATPNLIGTYKLSGEIQGLDVAGGHAYVVEWGDEGTVLRVIDVSIPAKPTQVGAQFGGARNVTVSGSYAYVAAGGSGVRVVDVADPTDPAEVGSFDEAHCAQDVAVLGGRAYIADGCNGIWVASLSDPASPAPVGFCSTPGTALSIAVAGDHAYVVDFDYGLRVVDSSTPSLPYEVGYYSTGQDARGLAIAGDYAYLADTSRGLWVVDSSDHSDPTTVGVHDTPGRAHDVVIGDSYAYVADGTPGLRVFDVRNPTSPRAVGACSTQGFARHVDLEGNHVYVGADYGLRVVDVSDPASPVVIGSFDTPGFVRGITVHGDYAYLCEDDSGLRVIDVSNPSIPAEVGLWRASDSPSWSPSAVFVRGDLAYVAEDCGLWVVDISDPAHLVEVASYELPGHPYDLTVAGDYAYLSSCSDGLYVVDISDPTDLLQVGTYNTVGCATNTVVYARDAYVADGSGGLVILHHLYPSTVTGQVRDGSDNPLAGVQISASSGHTDTTDMAGQYTLTALPSGTYTLTPTLAGYVFRPTVRTVSVPPDAKAQDFTILPQPVSTTLELSGTVSLATSLCYTDTQDLITRLTFPRGAVSDTTTVVLTPTLVVGGRGLSFAGHAFDLSALQGGAVQPDLAFNEPVTVTIHYSGADVRVVSDENELALYWWDGTGWTDASKTCDPPSEYVRDKVNRVLGVSICHLSRFGLFGPTHQIYLPLLLRSH